MNPWELVLANVLYLSVALRFGLRGDYGAALAFASYALANVGLFWSMRR